MKAYWGNTFSQERVPSVREFGWKIDSSGKLTIDWAPDLDRKLLKEFTTTCKHPKSLLSNVNCAKCGCVKKDIPCIEQCPMQLYKEGKLVVVYFLCEPIFSK